MRWYLDNEISRGDIDRISKRARVDQSQVGRILRGRFETLSPNVKKICKYANISTEEFLEKPGAASSRKLMDAIEHVWDGSEEVECFLANVIRGLKPVINKSFKG